MRLKMHTCALQNRKNIIFQNKILLVINILVLVQQVILENRASLYCCTFIVEPSLLV